MIKLTENAKAASRKISVQPNIVFKLTKFDKLFGSATISELIRIGDPGLEIGNDWVIGGVRAIQEQSPYISFNGGGSTTTALSQKLAPDRKEGTTVTSMVVSLIDKNEEISRLISPGFEIDDVIGTECEVWIGFEDTAFPEDYSIVFRGIVNDIDAGAGFVNFMLSAVEDKKRRAILIESVTNLITPIPAFGPVPTVDVQDASEFILSAADPEGNIDPNCSGIFRIDDEIFAYTGISGNTLTGVTRAMFNSIQAAHNAGTEVKRGVRLQGNGMTLALKLMLSGWSGPFVSDVQVKHFNRLSAFQPRPGAIFFERINLEKLYGLTVGDFVSTTGAINPANNISLKKITSIEVTDDGSFLTVDGVSLVDELDTPGTASFRSKYDSFPIGLKMSPAEVDVAQHETLRDFFLTGRIFDIRDGFELQNVKEFLDVECYAPMACFAIPRQGRASVTYSVGPIADQSITQIDKSNVLNADKLRVKRSLATNFHNTIKYSYDYNPVDNEYKSIQTFSSTQSKNRIPVGDKVLNVSSKGLLTGLSASQIQNDANRLLQRYQFGAEYINGVEMQFESGFPLEIGDVVLVDYGSLKLTDTAAGSRSGGLKFMEVLNANKNFRTGRVQLDLVNTSFAAGDRYATVSPSSQITTGATTTRLPLKRSFATGEFANEASKWQDYVGETILVHSPNWSYAYETRITAFSTDPKALLVSPALPIVPSENDIIDLAFYPTDSDPDVRKTIKLLHAFLSATVPIISSTSQTEFQVAAADIGKFLVGSLIRINNEDYSDHSAEAEVTAVDTTLNLVTISEPTGFNINNTHEAKLLSFADGGQSYRYI
jgi:hypothetical protein